MALGSGVWEGPFSYVSRFEDGGEAEETNPEELVGAALAGCFSMAFANELDQAGYTPERLDTEATVTLDMEDDPTITTVELVTEGEVPDADEDAFREIGAEAKENCPVSRALADVDVELDALLVG